MPFKFWKKDKPEAGKEKPAEGKEEKKAAPASVAQEKAKPSEPEAKTEEVKKPETKAPPRPPQPSDAESAASAAHAALVDMGLTVPATRAVFAKRVAAYPGGEEAFAADYQSAPYRAVTRVLADWLGFRVPDVFEPPALLSEMNLRLSSFKLSAQMKDLTWLDKELNLRKTRLSVGDQERVVRFKDARDLMKSVNELLAPKKVAFLELETWADDYAFILVRDPHWDKIAATDLVVVKADQTAKGGECGECGAPVGKYWSDCLKCGAVFG